MSPFESKNTSLLLMEVNGLVHPSFKDVRDLLHGVDHSGDLNVLFFSKESLHLSSVSHLGLCN